ncbi:hypothetical protein Taro_022371 [Colocasia esculenta]|uniref:C3H1-type domain-containing protein n=1 Tax=Colocasia esculenta TaxID=4460 RepID=A0A843V7Q2_COLES|nr:hypothetical protein [Colocasia esculenta]
MAYPSLFSSKKSSPFPFSNQLRYSTSVSLTPSSVSCEDESNEIAATEHRLYLARLTLQYEEMLDRYELCLSHLEEAVEKAEALRLDNAKLRIANAELARRLSFLSPYGKRGSGGGLMEASPGYPSNLVSELHRLHLGSDSPPSNSCPTRVPDYRQENRLTRKAPFPEQRSTLPKSISIRSSGYMKVPASSRNGRTRVFNPVLLGSFAHGIAELRPVIRHPRYKTEICRMILSGGTCPYGHRCHFRHALTPEDYGLPGTNI